MGNGMTTTIATPVFNTNGDLEFVLAEDIKIKAISEVVTQLQGSRWNLCISGRR